MFGECKLSRKNVIALYANSASSSKSPSIVVINKGTGMPINAYEIAVGYYSSFTTSSTTVEVISDNKVYLVLTIPNGESSLIAKLDLLTGGVLSSTTI